MKRFIFLLFCMATMMYAHAEVYKDLAAQFSVDIPEGWSISKQGDIYVFSNGEDRMMMSIMNAERGTTYSTNGAYFNLKKGEEGMENVKAHRGMWMTLYLHYVTRSYEQNGQRINEYYRIFPKTAFCFRTLDSENNEAKLAIARTVRLEPWNFWTQCKIMWLKLGFTLTLLLLIAWCVSGLFAAFLVSLFKEGPILTIVGMLLWLSIPLFWWDGWAMMGVMYGLTIAVFIPCMMKEVRKEPDSVSHSSSDEEGYDYVSPNRDILAPILADNDKMPNNYVCANKVREALDYQEGTNGRKKSAKKAFKCMLEAAQQGNVEAMIHVSYMYRDGVGVKRNRNEACEWMIKAAHSGSVPAILGLSAFTFFGYGRCITSHRDTISLLLKAKELGSPIAKKILEETTETVYRPTKASHLRLQALRKMMEEKQFKPELIEQLLESEQTKLPYESILKFKKSDELPYYFMTEKERKHDKRVGNVIEFVLDKLDDIIGYFV